VDHLTRPEGSQPEDFHLTRRTLTGLFFAGYAVAALSAEAAPIVTPDGGMIVEETIIPNGAEKGLPAYVARPKAKGHHPAIIVVTEIFGVHDYIKDVCRRLAAAGYVAIAPDFFYRSGVNLPAIEDRAQIMAVVAQAGEAQVDGDVRAVSHWLKAQAFVAPAKIGITGFCWGGAVVWRAAMVDPDIRAGVAWYGRLGPIIPRATELRAPVLGLYAENDKGIPVSDVEAMTAALKAAGKTGSALQIYPGVEHGFHADYRASYNAAAAADGWQRLLAFFKTNGVA
jgi:carboxymethylenebutenolidase